LTSICQDPTYDPGNNVSFSCHGGDGELMDAGGKQWLSMDCPQPRCDILLKP